MYISIVIIFLPFIILTIFFRVMGAKIRQSKALAMSHPQGWLTFSDHAKMIFHNPRGEQHTSVQLAIGSITFPFFLFGWFFLVIPVHRDPFFWAIFGILEILLALIAWLTLRISGPKDLELDLKQRTYKYIHQPPLKLPATKKQGILNEFSRVTVHYSRSSSHPYTSVVLMPQTSNHIKDGYSLGSFSNETEAMDFGKFIAERLEIKLVESGRKRASYPIATVRNARTNKHRIMR